MKLTSWSHQSRPPGPARNANQKVIIRAVSLSLLAAGATVLIAGRPGPKYVAHEWGTFTSVQGSDGVLLDWRPLESSHLPKFVYDWNHPGFGRISSSGMFSKARLITLQRMETPVIYFYSDQAQDVDVSVDFPQGTITEWYPQAAQIGPSMKPAPAAIAAADNVLHKAGAKPEFTLASLMDHTTTKNSHVRWSHLHVLSPSDSEKLAGSVPSDTSGSHYFSARETDASLLKLDSLVSTNPAPELEKFIFYRGAGNFATPLRVTTANSSAAALTVTISNTGKEALEHIFLLGLQNGNGRFIPVKRLAEGGQQVVQLDLTQKTMPIGTLSQKIADAMKKALVKDGLYPREAAAMVKTWKDSWFEEDGMRVLYLLPRSWTDRTLPLKIEPAPRELVRVMVGRAEVLAPASTEQLASTLTRAGNGDSQARQQGVQELKKLGRFAEPALRLALKNASAEVNQTGWNLFEAARQEASGLL